MAPSRFSGAKHTPKDGSASRPEALPRARTLLAVLLFYALVAAAFTYPLVRVDRPLLPHADDSYFNVWRLAWVAHQLGRDPAALFDSNVFHPLRNTLAYSDAMLGLGVLATPAIRLGVHPVVVHNLLVLSAFTTAAFAGFLLCRTLVASTAAALVGGVIVGFAPYRFAHIGHLELLWTAPMPLALLVLHRARTHPRSWRQGLLLGAIVAAQAYCSLYYAVFLALFIALWTIVALLLERGDARGRLVRCVAVGGVAGLLLTAPYGYVYYTVHRELGGRDVHEIRTHSATPSDYVRVNAGNRLYRPDPAMASEERSLFPGITASLLALCALILARRRTTVLYAALTVLAFDLSLGTNGIGYPLVSAAAPLLSGLRAPARFATLVLVALSVLASIGLHAVVRDLAAVPRRLVAGTLAVLCLAEYLVGADRHARANPDAAGGPSMATGAQRQCRAAPAAAHTGHALGVRDALPIHVDLPLEPAGQRLQRLRATRLRGHARSPAVAPGRRCRRTAPRPRGGVRDRPRTLLRAGGIRRGGHRPDAVGGFRRATDPAGSGGSDVRVRAACAAERVSPARGHRRDPRGAGR